MVLTGVVAVVWVTIKIASGHYPISDVLTETYVAVIVAALATAVLSNLFPKKNAEPDRIERRDSAQ
jgi:hypothetical protein